MDPFTYTYNSPLKGYEDLDPLPNDLSEDGKSYQNPPASKQSESYDRFVDGISNARRGGFDIHVYYFQNNPMHAKYAKELWERIRRQFPELRIYKLWDKPLGPHPVAMFEVNVFTPAQFGAFIPWLVINRGPLSALVHPNMEDDDGNDEEDPMTGYRNHTQRATWLGTPIPLDTSLWLNKAKKQAQES